MVHITQIKNSAASIRGLMREGRKSQSEPISKVNDSFLGLNPKTKRPRSHSKAGDQPEPVGAQRTSTSENPLLKKMSSSPTALKRPDGKLLEHSSFGDEPPSPKHRTSNIPDPERVSAALSQREARVRTSFIFMLARTCIFL